MDLVPVTKRGAAGDHEHSTQGAANTQAMSGMEGMKGGGATAGAETHGSEFVVPVERQQQIGVTYAKVERKPLEHSIRAVGIVETDLTRHWAFVARVDGYVQ